MSIDHVLIIEDDEVSSMLLQFLIEDVLQTKSVIIKRDGEEALQYLEETRRNSQEFPQLIFLDLNMPNLSGYEFTDLYETKFAPHSVNTQLVVLTSSVREKDREAAESHVSVAGFFHKPLEEQHLLYIKEIFENKF